MKAKAIEWTSAAVWNVNKGWRLFFRADCVTMAIRWSACSGTLRVDFLDCAVDAATIKTALRALSEVQACLDRMEAREAYSGQALAWMVSELRIPYSSSLAYELDRYQSAFGGAA